ncbi:MAG: GH3 auxin-responsive promoter family protein [Bacteroidetes bacterium]|nr:GH3 auxin-responsive promoter family protein [Bacteroidota bacterium]
MGWKAALSLPFARWAMRRLRKNVGRPTEAQAGVLEALLRGGANTAFGRDHGLKPGLTASEFAEHVPVRDYEGLKPYVDRAVKGEEDVLWPGRPLYFCKTSGTTSGAKYIPLTKDSMPNHIGSARNALLGHIAGTGDASFVDGKIIFLQGSPELAKTPGGVHLGRLSGIVAHHVPSYLQANRLPSWETNCIDDWETKVDAVVRETCTEDLRLVSGIPSWVQMYFERLLEHTGKATVREVFPNLSLFVHGGVAFGPYAERFRQLLGFDIARVELYPASEGFLAYQDAPGVEGMLLNVNDGIYFEFIPADRYFDEKPPRLTVGEVEVGVQYAVVLSTNAGLWGYDIGDTVKFVSLDPPRVVVTGRIKHFTSAFGEHVIAEEVEGAAQEAMAAHGGVITEFHVAPQVTPDEGLPYHEWVVAFETPPTDFVAFSATLDKALQTRNPYYKDLIQGAVLRPAVVTPVPAHRFTEAMRKRGKLGGQNKIPRLANDRDMADLLLGASQEPQSVAT